MSDYTPIPLASQAGIQRDGTKLDSSYYSDGQWVRFQRGRARKMGGYQLLTNLLPEVSRGLDVYASGGYNYVHTGGASQLMQYVFAPAVGGLQSSADRTPAGFVFSPDNVWHLVTMFDAVSTTLRLIAHAAPNLTSISSTGATALYYGDVTAAAALTAIPTETASGGICVLFPYLIAYGASWDWSAPNKPGDFTTITVTGQAHPVADKIVYGLPLRGAGSIPSGIFWSLETVFVASFVGGTATWVFNVLTSQSSILSSQGVVEYDSVFYWAGVDRFLMFNGVLQELPNQLSINYFYDNVNPLYTQKVYAFKVPRWGEIWWCYPRGNATECTHAVIFNVRERTWYDTQLPEDGRSAAHFAQAFPRPILAGVNLNSGGGYNLWQHESGVDKIDGTGISPIRSFIETNNITMINQEPAKPNELSVSFMEPDILQSGNMTVTITGQANARSTPIDGAPKTYLAVPLTPADTVIPFTDTRRLMRFRFESDVIGGDYQMGATIVHVKPGGERVT